MRKIILLLLFVDLSFAFSHNPFTSTLIIKKQEGVWSLTASIPGVTIEKCLQSYYKDKNITIQDSPEFLAQLEKYLLEHISIKINKHYDIELTNFGFLPDYHASEMRFILKGIPPKADYWDFNVTIGSEMETHTCVVKIADENALTQVFIEKSFPRVQLIRNKEGELIKIKG